MRLTAYFAHLDFIQPLEIELRSASLNHSKAQAPCKIIAQYDRLFLCEGEPVDSVWAQNIWVNPQWISFDSIKDAATKLKTMQRNWTGFHFAHHRRLELITQQLPYISDKRLAFMAEVPKSPMGAFTLIEPNLMLAASHTSSPWPHGRMEFNEDKESPPSRAYLKLWEIFTRLQITPKPGEICMDLGASPGGWTWVLAGLDANVIAFDRAPLTENLMADPRVQFKKGDAFAAQPSEYPQVDWIFSDLICYPEKLLEYLQPWLLDSKPRNFVCTIKLQGENPYEVLNKFKAINHSQIIHLYHNKHEVTWILLNQSKIN